MPPFTKSTAVRKEQVGQPTNFNRTKIAKNTAWSVLFITGSGTLVSEANVNRRTFLVAFGGTAAAFASGVALRTSFWWDQTPATSLKILSQHEVNIIQTMGEAMFPGDLGMPAGNTVGLPEFMDDYLANIPELTANLLRLLLHAIDDMAVMADFGTTRFHKRPLDERIAILQAWDSSWLGPRRGAFTSIKILLAMGYCEHPAVIQAAGITYTCGAES